MDSKRQVEAYARVFADMGFDVESGSPTEVAARIRRRAGTAVQVAAALDDWALVVRDCGLRDPKRDPAVWKRLLEIARSVDPDPWRAELRRLMEREDLSALRKLADESTESDIGARPVQSLQLMGSALAIGGDLPACIVWHRRAHRQHPGDALLAFELAFHLSELPSADWAEVLRFAEAALAARQSPSMYHMVGVTLIRLGRHGQAALVFRKAIESDPDVAFLHHYLGVALTGQKKLDGAIAEYRRAIELDPKYARAYYDLGNALYKQGMPDEAIAEYKKPIELNPKNAQPHASLGSFYAQLGRWKEAAAAIDRALALDPMNHERWCQAATAHAAAGDLEGYRRTCLEMLKRFGGTNSSQTAEGTAKTCVLLPGTLSPADFNRVQKLAERAVTGTEKDRYFDFFAMAKDLVDYRAGRYADAVKWEERAHPHANAAHWDAIKFAVLAMAHHRLGHAKEGEAALSNARAILAKIPDPAKGRPFGAAFAALASDWYDWQHARVLYREAEELITGAVPRLVPERAPAPREK